MDIGILGSIASALFGVVKSKVGEKMRQSDAEITQRIHSFINIYIVSEYSFDFF